MCFGIVNVLLSLDDPLAVIFGMEIYYNCCALSSLLADIDVDQTNEVVRVG